jgi:hypothetical protein
MKSKHILLALCLLLLGIAIGFYLARKVWPPHKVIVMRFNPVGDMIVGARAGDQVEWFNGDVHTAVQFKFGLMPCTDNGGPPNGMCTMKDSAIYPFNCTASGCKDPGLGGGDDTFRNPHGQVAGSHLDPPYASPATVNVYCDPSTNTAKADAVVQGKQGTAFTIQVAGAPDFTATFPSGTCDPGDSLNGAGPNCRIKPTVAVDTNYAYGITVSGCTNPGSSTLTELKP